MSVAIPDMSYCREEGKDRIIFVTPEDHNSPSTVEFTEKEEESRPGLITEDGEINWSCPCLGGMATGPCGVEFRDAFSCFHYSEADPKGSDCVDAFRIMAECMSNYPGVYGSEDSDEQEKNDSEPEHSSSVSEKQLESSKSES